MNWTFDIANSPTPDSFSLPAHARPPLLSYICSRTTSQQRIASLISSNCASQLQRSPARAMARWNLATPRRSGLATPPTPLTSPRVPLRIFILMSQRSRVFRCRAARKVLSGLQRSVSCFQITSLSVLTRKITNSQRGMAPPIGRPQLAATTPSMLASQPVNSVPVQPGEDSQQLLSYSRL